MAGGKQEPQHQKSPHDSDGPAVNLAVTKVPDCTPGIVAKYAFNDEQALLARVRYNRLVDLFSGVVCYSLQNHLRTTVPEMGQVREATPLVLSRKTSQRGVRSRSRASVPASEWCGNR